MLHGFTQTGGCLGPLGDALSTRHVVLRPDLPGHGGAAALADMDLWATASHLASSLAPTLDAPAVWFGYSMGGRVALHVALAHPELVSGLVLVGATAGIDDPAERAQRAAADDALARRVEDIGVDAFVDEWLALPLFGGLPTWARFDDERRRNTAAGLAGSLRHAGTGTMDPLWSSLAEIHVPVLCLAGGRDAKFRDLAQRMADAALGHLPDATVEVVGDSGHAVHLERPDEVASLVVPFCDRLAPLTAARDVEPPPRWYESPT